MPAVTQMEIKAAVSKRDLIEHFADARAIGDVRSKANGQAAIGNSRARNADSQAIFVSDLLRGRARGIGVQVHANDVRAFFHEAVRRFFSDARTRADDDDDLPRQFFFRRHAFQLRLFEQPVFDVKRLLLGKRNVFINRLPRPA